MSSHQTPWIQAVWRVEWLPYSSWLFLVCANENSPLITYLRFLIPSNENVPKRFPHRFKPAPDVFKCDFGWTHSEQRGFNHAYLPLPALACSLMTHGNRKCTPSNKTFSLTELLITCSWQPPKKHHLGVCGLSLSSAWCLTNYNLLQYNNIQLIKDQCDISRNLVFCFVFFPEVSEQGINHSLVELQYTLVCMRTASDGLIACTFWIILAPYSLNKLCKSGLRSPPSFPSMME